MGDAEQAEWIAYQYLGALQSELVDILERVLPDAVPARTILSQTTIGATRWVACAGTGHHNRGSVSTGPAVPVCSRSWARAKQLRRW